MQLLYLAVDEDDGGEKKIIDSSFLRTVLYYHIDLVPIPENCSYFCYPYQCIITPANKIYYIMFAAVFVQFHPNRCPFRE